jgi:hypothetical protein
LALSNLIATKSKAADHMHVPIKHWKDCLQSAAFLGQRQAFIASLGRHQ